MASSELQGLIQRDYLGITVLCFIFILIQSMFLVYLLWTRPCAKYRRDSQGKEVWFSRISTPNEQTAQGKPPECSVVSILPVGWAEGCRNTEVELMLGALRYLVVEVLPCRVSLRYSGGKELGSTWYGWERAVVWWCKRNKVSLTSKSACWWGWGGRQAHIDKTKCSLKRDARGVGKEGRGGWRPGEPERHHRGSDDSEFWRRRRILAEVIPQTARAWWACHVLEVLSGLMGLEHRLCMRRVCAGKTS